jgi:hypothetical protein
MRRAAVAVACMALTLGITTLGMTASAHAGCTEQARRIDFGGTEVVNLKAFNCSSGADTFRVEFHRFAEAPASLIVAKRQTKLMQQAFGSPKVIENEVFRTYADLLQKFGAAVRLSGDINNASTLYVRDGQNANSSSAAANDTLPGRSIRQILGSEGLFAGNYPAVNEIAALRKKTIPEGLKFKYSAVCRDDRPPNGSVDVECADFDLSTVSTTFWRPFRRADADDYGKNVTAFNRALGQFTTELRSRNPNLIVDQSPLPATGLSNKLKFFQSLTGNNWPDDFLIVYGSLTDACGSDTVAGIDGWSFNHSSRAIFLDAILIENTSKTPLRIGGLLGSQISAPALRRADARAAPGETAIAMTETLAPGQRILIPTKIHLEANERVEFETVKQSKSLLDRVGLNGFTGSASAHGFPDLPDYNYGPELGVRAFMVNGARVDLERQAANFIDLSVSGEIGSCPYLMSWDANNREWVDHGKVLHNAPNQAREYTEARTIEGFISRYRIEEREAEVAFIDQVALVVSLASGRAITIEPGNAALARRDGSYLRLAWGESAEIDFVLPADVPEDEVLASRLEVTGYYLRYSDLLARGLDIPGATGVKRASAPLCPTPSRFSPLRASPLTAG